MEEVAPENTYLLVKQIIRATPSDQFPVGFMPEGYAGDVVPEGWLSCEGQILSQTEYPELFEILGTAYNHKYRVKNPARRWYHFRKSKFITITENVPGLFRLPDFRGKVMPELQQ